MHLYTWKITKLRPTEGHLCRLFMLSNAASCGNSEFIRNKKVSQPNEWNTLWNWITFSDFPTKQNHYKRFQWKAELFYESIQISSFNMFAWYSRFIHFVRNEMRWDDIIRYHSMANSNEWRIKLSHKIYMKIVKFHDRKNALWGCVW